MYTSNPYIVCLGRDYMLLHTRRHLLVQAGYKVFVTSNLLTVAKLLLNEKVSILVLCHTLPPEEALVISKFHRDTRSTATILSMTAGWGKPEVTCVGQVCEAWKGPAAFLAAVTKLSSNPISQPEGFRPQPGVPLQQLARQG